MIVTRGLDSGGLRPAEQGALGLRPAHNAGCKGAWRGKFFQKFVSTAPGPQERTALRALDLPIEPPGTVISRPLPLPPPSATIPCNDSARSFPPLPIDKSPIKR